MASEFAVHLISFREFNKRGRFMPRSTFFKWAIFGLTSIAASTLLAQTTATNPAGRGAGAARSDANGNPLRIATKSGHISNYDESKVHPYALPDPLLMADGKRVLDAKEWFQKRRPEILK